MVFIQAEYDGRRIEKAMKKILFLHPGKAYLPELLLYKKFFAEYEFFNCQELTSYTWTDFDLIWQFMGVDVRFSKATSIPRIHEYASLSVGRGAKWKDTVKRHLNVKPSLRIFLNEEIRKRYGFHDDVPYCYRDMGVDTVFFHREKTAKKYDFVYVGHMGAERGFAKVLDFFSHHPEKSLLLIGTPDEALYQFYQRYDNLIFAGRIPYEMVPSLAREAEYALNYIPNVYPYYLQTSTKLLEYVAMDLKIVTTDYAWVNAFEKRRKMRFYKIKEDFSDMDWEKLRTFPFCNSSVEDLQWKNILEQSRIRERLAELLGG